MKPLLSILLLLCISKSGYGQLTQYWTDVTVQKQQTEKISWTVQGGPRFQKSYGMYSTFVTSALNYKMSRVFTVVGGFSYFFSNPPGKNHLHEIRPWQGVRIDFKLHQRSMFLNNVRIEERWFLYKDSEELLFRFRYQTGFNFTILQNKEKGTRTYVPISFEIFEELGKKIFINMERVYAGVGYEFPKNRVELYYINQQQRVNTESPFQVTQNIARARWIFILQ
jgi:hypothetical protein